MDPVSVKRAAPVRYASRSEQLGAAPIDVYVRDTPAMEVAFALLP